MSTNPLAHWLGYFSKSGPHGWRCPHCRIGYLALISDTFATRDVSQHTRYPEEFESVFSCLLSCPRCNRAVAVSGIGCLDPEWDQEQGTQGWKPCFRPRSVTPSPDLIEIRGNYPRRLREQLRRSFTL